MAAPDPFDQAFERMYNCDFQGAHTIIDGYLVHHAQEPLPYAIRASALLFQELDRLGILEGEFFADDKRIIDKKKLRPDANTRVRFLQAAADVHSRANPILAANPNDRNALFSLCIAQGVTTDYMALIEKRQIASLSSARSSNDYAQRLLKLDPQYYDAYLTTGVTEYLVGSLPFFIRWFVHFDNVEGSKEKGMKTMTVVARHGRFLRPFAKILLAIGYLRDKQPLRSRELLVELTRDYPANSLLRRELVKLDGRMAVGAN